MDQQPEGSPPRSKIAALTARILAADLLPARRPSPTPNRTGSTVVATTQRQRSRADNIGIPGWFPSGEAHAVPDGAVIALCGYAPPYIWQGRFQPELRGLSVCPSCAAAFSAR